MSSVPIKLVVVGDGSIGKTCIMIRYIDGYFKTEYVPTIFDNITKTIQKAGRTVNISLWDTAGQEDYSQLRTIAYPNTDIFLIVFSVVDPESFRNAKKKWMPEVKGAVPSANVLFVGSKMDLRDSLQLQSQPLLKKDFQKNINEQMHCGYVQCSALTSQGISEVFDTAIETVLISKGILKSPSVSSNSHYFPVPVQKSMAQPGYCSCQIM